MELTFHTRYFLNNRWWDKSLPVEVEGIEDLVELPRDFVPHAATQVTLSFSFPSPPEVVSATESSHRGVVPSPHDEAIAPHISGVGEGEEEDPAGAVAQAAATAGISVVWDDAGYVGEGHEELKDAVWTEEPE